jgi:hypothetical protein
MTTPDQDWSDQYERVAIWLYREDHDWSAGNGWVDLSELARQRYINRAKSLGQFFNFPYHTTVVHQLNSLCPCDYNPETTEGPERDCPLHGDLPYAIDRVRRGLRLLEQAERLEGTLSGWPERQFPPNTDLRPGDRVRIVDPDVDLVGTVVPQPANLVWVAMDGYSGLASTQQRVDLERIELDSE